MKPLIIFVACLTLPLNAIGEGTTFHNADEFVASISKKSEKISFATALGDMNGDGKNDLALLLRTTKDGRVSDEIVLLLGTEKKTFQNWLESKPDDLASRGLTAKIDRIKQGSLFIYLEGSQGFWGTYQFQFRSHDMRLIGAKIHLAECVTENGDCKSVDTDINFLTGMINLDQELPIEARKRDRAIFPHCNLSHFDFNPYFAWKMSKPVSAYLTIACAARANPTKILQDNPFSSQHPVSDRARCCTWSLRRPIKNDIDLLARGTYARRSAPTT
jgi:hypothetical protein